MLPAERRGKLGEVRAEVAPYDVRHRDHDTRCGIAQHMGQLVVGGISDGGPADRAGLQRGDILHALNDEVLDDVADFYRKLWGSGAAGTTIRLRMERDNDAFEVAVRSGDRSRYHKYGSD